ncbi:transporter substrate-binding domain-containing protein [Bdellovibrio sp. NC01]|uniref:transporter substrate-binding domain-containing protein n=1 Tax=Bdellovibrio sp. NC01 TaxID=2220073 RepID=UPI001158FA89|nr:transporter substrate-binding domain-containing protein [Bdellovibrio sp. NC01]QDK38049.1 hypothetical protein DOE51_10850 [Bdellovibrio sp. NC01]
MARFLVLILLMAPLKLFATTNSAMTLSIPEEVTNLQSVREYTQFLIDTLKDANIDLIPKNVPQRRCRDLVEKGQLDVIIYDDLVSGFKSRENLVHVSFPIAFSTANIFYSSEIKNFNVDNLKNYKGAYTIGNLMIEREAQRRGLNATSMTSALQGLQMIKTKRLDYYIALKSTGESVLQKDPGMKELIKVSDKPLLKIPTYFTFHKKHKDKLAKIEASFRKRLHGDLSKYPMIAPALNKDLRSSE